MVSLQKMLTIWKQQCTSLDSNRSLLLESPYLQFYCLTRGGTWTQQNRDETPNNTPSTTSQLVDIHERNKKQDSDTHCPAFCVCVCVSRGINTLWSSWEHSTKNERRQHCYFMFQRFFLVPYVPAWSQWLNITVILAFELQTPVALSELFEDASSPQDSLLSAFRKKPTMVCLHTADTECCQYRLSPNSPSCFNLHLGLVLDSLHCRLKGEKKINFCFSQSNNRMVMSSWWTVMQFHLLDHKRKFIKTVMFLGGF